MLQELNINYPESSDLAIDRRHLVAMTGSGFFYGDCQMKIKDHSRYVTENTKRIVWGDDKVCSGVVGNLSEYQAVCWLLSRDYAVFKNTCWYGPIDIVACRDKEFLKIDIKTVIAWIRADGSVRCGKAYRRKNQSKNIMFLYVAPSLGCSFNYKDLEPLIETSLREEEQNDPK